MEEKRSKSSYQPLIALVGTGFVAASALTVGLDGGLHAWMHFFMGFTFCLFSMLKFFNISGFADGFQMYDLIAKKSRGYALSYPWIELFLGVSYLAFWVPVLIYLLTVLIMAIGVVGVVKALKNKLDIRCACMGTALNVPLSTVTLAEDIGMGALALFMFLLSL